MKKVNVVKFNQADKSTGYGYDKNEHLTKSRMVEEDLPFEDSDTIVDKIKAGEITANIAPGMEELVASIISGEKPEVVILQEDGYEKMDIKQQFSAEAVFALKNYVYALIDPSNTHGKYDGIFYIGKGTGNRCFAHAEWVKSKDFSLQSKDASLKEGKIHEILERGDQVEVKIVAHGIDDPKEAFKIESMLKKVMGETTGIDGHDSANYFLSPNEIENALGEPVRLSDLPRKNILLVSLNQTYTDAGEDIYKLGKATLGDWGVGKHANEVELIIGIYGKLMVTFFDVETDPEEVNRENREKGKHRRFRWVGSPNKSLWCEYKNRSLHISTPDGLTETEFAFGRQQAIKYLPATKI